MQQLIYRIVNAANAAVSDSLNTCLVELQTCQEIMVSVSAQHHASAWDVYNVQCVSCVTIKSTAHLCTHINEPYQLKDPPQELTECLPNDLLDMITN